MKKKLSWKPVRRGETYCSSGCGGGCTYADYDSAVRESKKALAKMRGVGWHTRVWENLGWHWSLVFKTGLLSIDTYDDGNTFRAALSLSYPCSCDAQWYRKRYFKDPNRAVSDILWYAIRDLTSERDQVISIINQTKKRKT